MSKKHRAAKRSRSYHFTFHTRSAKAMEHLQRFYTPKASLCALGLYVRQQHLLDDLENLPVPIKKGLVRALGETH